MTPVNVLSLQSIFLPCVLVRSLFFCGCSAFAYKRNFKAKLGAVIQDDTQAAFLHTHIHFRGVCSCLFYCYTVRETFL